MSNPTEDTTSGIGGPCPTGYYCPQQTEDPIPCPNGTYRDVIRGEKLSDCIACKLGSYCGSTNLSDVSGPCDPGFYCIRGSKVPNPEGKTILLYFMYYTTHFRQCLFNKWFTKYSCGE